MPHDHSVRAVYILPDALDLQLSPQSAALGARAALRCPETAHMYKLTLTYERVHCVRVRMYNVCAHAASHVHVCANVRARMSKELIAAAFRGRRIRARGF